MSSVIVSVNDLKDIPPDTTSLTFGECFNQELKIVTSLTFGWRFNQELWHLKNVENLTLRKNYNSKIIFPTTLKKIIILNNEEKNLPSHKILTLFEKDERRLLYNEINTIRAHSPQIKIYLKLFEIFCWKNLYLEKGMYTHKNE